MASIKELEDEQGLQFHSSVNELRQFIESPVWTDLRNWIEMQNTADQQRLVKADTMDEIRKLQGKLEVGLEMLDLPSLLITLLSDEDNGR